MKLQPKHKLTVFVLLAMLIVVFLLSIPVIYYAIFDPDLLSGFIEEPTAYWWWKYYYLLVLAGCLFLVVFISRKKFRD